MQRLTVLSAAAGALVISPASLAADVPDPDTVIVTATRTAVTADESLASVTVIRREDIERSQAANIPELLTGLAGMDFTVNGGYGKNSSLFLRGTGSGHVLVMIDGVKVGSATLGTTAFQHIPLSQIERIEIVRGPRSSLYGSEAIGGVIQIFTRKGRKETRGNVAAGVGSYGTSQISSGVSGGRNASRYSVFASRFNTDGIDARQPISSLDEPDADGYTNNSLTARIDHRFDNGMTFNVHGFRAQGETEFDGNFQNRTDFVQESVGAELGFSPASTWKSKLNVGQSRDETDNFKDQSFVSTFNTKRDVASWQNDVTLGDKQLLTLGLDYQQDAVSSTTAYDRSSRDNKGLFGQYQATVGKHDFQFSLRTDDNEQFGKRDTGNIGWGYAFADGRRITVSYGTAFKAPTFNQLYFPGFGNPDLRPEKSESFEIGLRGKQARLRWDVRTYYTVIDNLIATVFDSGTGKFTAKNVDKAKIKGLEIELSTTVNGWDLATHLTFLDPRDDTTDKVLRRRAKRSLKLDLNRRFGKASAGITWVAQSHRFEDAANNTRIGGYGIVNAHAQYRLNKKWVVRGKIDNLFDKQYQTIRTYNHPGRNLLLTVAYQTR